jgi:hypothetical protein
LENLPPPIWTADVRRLHGALEAERGRRHWATNPLNLRFMLEVFADGYELPPDSRKAVRPGDIAALLSGTATGLPKGEDQAEARREVKRLEPACSAWLLPFSWLARRRSTTMWAARQLVRRPWRWLPEPDIAACASLWDWAY